MLENKLYFTKVGHRFRAQYSLEVQENAKDARHILERKKFQS